MKTMTGAELTIALLERQGIRQLPGIPGGANLPLYDALSKSSKINHILARHEQGAGFIAQGIARATGEAAACFATSGPGATNLLTAVADARLDSIPLVAITGQVPASMIGTDAFQEIDAYGMSLPATKHNFLVRSAEELLHVIPEAFRIALSDRPGPVWIDIPKDVQNERAVFERWPEPGAAASPKAAGDAFCMQFAEELLQAKRPILYLGGGCVASGACSLARELAEKASLPTVSTLMGLGALPASHPLNMGMLGMHGARFVNQALEECDLLIAIGARFDDRAVGKASEFCPGARIAHIDIDACEIGKIKAPRLWAAADAAATLRKALPSVRQIERPEWLARIDELRAHGAYSFDGAENPRAAYGLMLQAARILQGRETIYSTDVGQHQMRAAQCLPFDRPRQWLTSGGLGTMGFGLPAAIGAALARPEAVSVCFSGDGSALMNIQELALVSELGLNVKLVVQNNNALGLVRQQQELFYGKRFHACAYPFSHDFVGIGRAFGVRSVDLDTADDPARALAEALLEEGPTLIHSTIPAEENVFPMVPPGAANRDMIGGKAHASA